MNTMKRLSVLCLCVVLIVTMLAFPANATSVTDTASLGSHAITVNLYIDSMVFSAYTKFEGVADYLYVEADLWQKNTITGAITQRSALTDSATGAYVNVYSSLYGGNYVFYCTKSYHRVEAENQSWSCSLGRIYA